MVDLTTNTSALPVYTVDSTGAPVSAGLTYTLALAASLASGASTSATTVTRSASYGWSYTFTGTSPSLALQTLGADGITWQTVATVAASGGQGIAIFAGSGGAPVRLTNTGTNAISALNSSLSS